MIIGINKLFFFFCFITFFSTTFSTLFSLGLSSSSFKTSLGFKGFKIFKVLVLFGITFSS